MADELTDLILNAAFVVHSELGPGMLESAYEACLAHVLCSRGLAVERQVSLSIEFRGLKLEEAYRMDLVVEGRVVVEVKAVERILPVHEAQLLTSLRFSGIRVGLLLNFNVGSVKDGIRRRVMGFE